MADALKRWRERCEAAIEPAAYRPWQALTMGERGGLLRALDRIFDPLGVESRPVETLELLIALKADQPHAAGLRLALRWLREEMERENA